MRHFQRTSLSGENVERSHIIIPNVTSCVFEMNIFTHAPVSICARIVGDWLSVVEMGKLEIAMCSFENRLQLMYIVQQSVIQFDSARDSALTVAALNWMVVHKVKVSSLSLSKVLPKSAGTLVISLVVLSSTTLTSVVLYHNDFMVRALTQCCSNLVSLELEGCRVDTALGSLLSNANRLSRLRLTDCVGINLDDLAGKVREQVEWLTVVGAMSSEVLTELIRACSKVKTFTRYKGTFDFNAISSSTLTRLNLESCTVTVSDRVYSAHDLRLDRCNLTDTSLLSILRVFNNLRVLSMIDNPHLTGTSLRNIADTRGKSIKLVKLAYCNNLNDISLSYMCQKCENLSMIDISHTDCYNDSIAVAVLTNGKKITDLRLNHTNISDTALLAIANSKITALEMNDTFGYTEDALSTLITTCASLRFVSINSPLLNPLVLRVWKKVRPELRFVPPIRKYFIFR